MNTTLGRRWRRVSKPANPIRANEPNHHSVCAAPHTQDGGGAPAVMACGDGPHRRQKTVMRSGSPSLSFSSSGEDAAFNGHGPLLATASLGLEEDGQGEDQPAAAAAASAVVADDAVAPNVPEGLVDVVARLVQLLSDQGGVVVVEGPAGCGKSTACRLALAQLGPTVRGVVLRGHVHASMEVALRTLLVALGSPEPELKARE